MEDWKEHLKQRTVRTNKHIEDLLDVHFNVLVLCSKKELRVHVEYILRYAFEQGYEYGQIDYMRQEIE